MYVYVCEPLSLVTHSPTRQQYLVFLEEVCDAGRLAGARWSSDVQGASHVGLHRALQEAAQGHQLPFAAQEAGGDGVVERLDGLFQILVSGGN